MVDPDNCGEHCIGQPRPHIHITQLSSPSPHKSSIVSLERQTSPMSFSHFSQPALPAAPPSSLPGPSHPRLTMASPLFPWEVIERIIGHSGDHRKTLHNFSLTCRDLRPRALCLLVADVAFRNSCSMFDFCDFVKAKPHLKPLVRSVAVNANDFAPFPLLNVLPNLSNLKLADYRKDVSPTFVNRKSLTCCELFGTHIQTLHLSFLRFPTSLAFAHLLLAFSNINHLVCKGIDIRAEGSPAPLELIKRRLTERLHLLTVSPHACCRCEDYG